MSRSYGRYHVAEPPHLMGAFHQHDEKAVQLKEVDWEPKVQVLDQEDLIAQSIFTDQLIKGAARVDALGSCVFNTTVEALSNVLSVSAFGRLPKAIGVPNVGAQVLGYSSTVLAEKTAILLYHLTTDLTGDPSTEYPPTDCGSSGQYVTTELERLGLVKGAKLASGADNVVSLLQTGGLMVGMPFLQVWETPETVKGIKAVVDGDGSRATFNEQLAEGIAGGHEVYLSAIEHLEFYPAQPQVVNPWETIVRFRNHWTPEWGDNGNFRMHLSTVTHIMAAYVDFRQLQV